MLWNQFRFHIIPQLRLLRRSMHFSRSVANPPQPALATVRHDTRQSSVSTFGNFDLLKSYKLNYADVNISRCRSRVTGVSVVHLDYEGVRATLKASCC